MASNVFIPNSTQPIVNTLDKYSQVTYQEICSTIFVAPSTALPIQSRFWSNTSLNEMWQSPQQLPIDRFKNFKIYNIRMSTNLVPSALTDQNQAILRDTSFLRISKQSKAYPNISLSGLFGSTIETAGSTYVNIARTQLGLNIGSADPMFVMGGDEEWSYELFLPNSITTGLTGLFPTLPNAPTGFTNGVYFKLILTGQIERPVG